MLLNAINYDPATQVVYATSTALAMTAFDTTNLRLTFTAPPTGRVLVRLRGTMGGNSTAPGVYLGMLSGATVVMRSVPMGPSYQGNASTLGAYETTFVVTGLTSGQSYTWDAAYGVDYPVSGTSFRIGGPNDATANNAGGAFHFEVWEA